VNEGDHHRFNVNYGDQSFVVDMSNKGGE